MTNPRRLLICSFVLSATAVAAGCMVVDPVSVLGCEGPACRLAFHGQIVSADGGEVTVPFDCRSSKWTPDTPKGRYEELKAIAYTVATGSWRVVPFTAQDLAANESGRETVRAVPDEMESVRSCAADCSKFAYLARVDPKNPVFDWEIFYSENGQVRQLTHGSRGTEFYSPHLSADGRTVFAWRYRDIALIDVATGKVTVVPFGERAWKECAGS